jgi:hypothetical protein
VASAEIPGSCDTPSRRETDPQPSHRIWKKAGMFRVALPHGRDEKVQQKHSSHRQAESAAADLQLHS